MTQCPLCDLVAAVAAAAAGRCQVWNRSTRARGVKIIDTLAVGAVLAIQSRRPQTVQYADEFGFNRV